MSLETILRKIADDAALEAEDILREGRKKADEIKEKAKDEAEELAEGLIEEGAKQGRLEASRIVTQARMEKRLRILSIKKNLIDHALEQALKKQRLDRGKLKRIVVLKDGQREEEFDYRRLKDELRPKVEKEIVKLLKL